MSELEKRLMKHIDLLVERYPSLESEKNSIISALNRVENVKSALWFYENVFCKLKDTSWNLVLLGSHPDEKLVFLSQQDERVIVTGFVKDIRPWLQNCACMIAPLVMGAGIKVKVLEALSAGVPLLTNEIGMEGINAENEKEYFHCQTAEDYLGITNANKGKSRAITHSFGTKLKALMLGEEVEITFCDVQGTKKTYKFTEVERMSFVLFGILYASRCNNFHGNVAARMNSINANKDTFKMYTDMFLTEYIILAIHLNSQGALSDVVLNKVKKNANLMI